MQILGHHRSPHIEDHRLSPDRPGRPDRHPGHRGRHPQD